MDDKTTRTLVVLGVGAVVSIVYVVLRERRTKRRLERYFAGRQRQSLAELATTYFAPEQAAAAIAVLDEFERASGDDLSRVRPSDRLTDVIPGLDEVDMADVLPHIERKLDVKIPREEAMRWVSLQDVVTTVHEAQRRRPTD